MIYRFGSFELDIDRFELRRAGEVCPIERKTFNLLRHLIEHREAVVSREQLIDSLWEGRAVSDSALSSQIKSARKIVDDDGEKQLVIRTIHGRGFRFVAPLEIAGNAKESATAAREVPTQEIRYCKSADGTRIAYSIMGDGPPLLKVANWPTHLEHELENRAWASWLARLNQHRQLIRYDQRGNGLSDREPKDVSFDATVADLEAVAGATDHSAFDLIGVSHGCAAAVEFAVRHPDKVRQLILYGGFAMGWRGRNDEKTIADREAIHTLIRLHWGSEDLSIHHMMSLHIIPEAEPAVTAALADLQKTALSAETAARIYSAYGDIDVTARLAAVRAPTLVLHSRGDRFIPLEQGRDLAIGIPGARFVTLETQNHILTPSEPAFERFFEEVERFLDTAVAA